jgi:hypothetical protein
MIRKAAEVHRRVRKYARQELLVSRFLFFILFFIFIFPVLVALFPPPSPFLQTSFLSLCILSPCILSPCILSPCILSCSLTRSAGLSPHSLSRARSLYLPPPPTLAPVSHLPLSLAPSLSLSFSPHSLSQKPGMSWMAKQP